MNAPSADYIEELSDSFRTENENEWRSVRGETVRCYKLKTTFIHSSISSRSRSSGDFICPLWKIRKYEYSPWAIAPSRIHSCKSFRSMSRSQRATALCFLIFLQSRNLTCWAAFRIWLRLQTATMMNMFVWCRRTDDRDGSSNIYFSQSGKASFKQTMKLITYFIAHTGKQLPNQQFAKNTSSFSFCSVSFLLESIVSTTKMML